jgi:regulator of sigma E protease
MPVLLFILNLIVFILVLGVMICIHELGHFLMAKRFKVLVYEFSLGMGPLVYQKRKGETAYSVRAIPFGGYCAMAGEDLNQALIKKEEVIGIDYNEENIIQNVYIGVTKKPEYAFNVALFEQLTKDLTLKTTGIVKDYNLYDDSTPLYIDLESNGVLTHYLVNPLGNYVESPKNRLQFAPKSRSLEAKPKLQRFVVMVAGVTFNFLLALFIFLLLAGINGVPSTDPILGNLSSAAPASQYLAKGDVIKSVNGINVDIWSDINKWQTANPADYRTVNVVYERNGVEQSAQIPTMISLNLCMLTNYTADGTIVLDQAVVGTSGDKSKELKPGDIILEIEYVDVNNHTIITGITNWNDLYVAFQPIDGQTVTFTVLRNGEQHQYKVNTYTEELLTSQNVSKSNLAIGVSPVYHFDFGMMFVNGFKAFASDAVIIFRTLGLLFRGKVGVGELSGPIGIFQVVGSAMKQGFTTILRLLGLLCVNVGIMNLLPIPAVDGGRILFLGIEAVTRKKINPKVENTVNNVFFYLLMAFMLFMVVFDIIKLF